MSNLINFKTRVRRRYRGSVTYRVFDQKTGKVVKAITSPNVITYAGADFFARAMAGQTSYRITHMYAEHADPIASGYTEGSTNGLTAARTDTVATMRTSPRTTDDAESVIINTAFASSDSSLYSGNIVTYFAVFDNPNLNDEIIVGAGLISRQPNGDEICVCHNYTEALIKLAGFSVMGVWSVQFE